MKAKPILVSKWGSSPKIATLALEYPRFIHGEFMTHRVFSRNCASSRAIPISSVIENIRENPADVVYWGKAMSGMQAREGLGGVKLFAARAMWAIAREACILIARGFNAVRLHKQIANRILEPFQTINVLVTSTEWDNFIALRDHESAQPEMQHLAKLVKDALDSAEVVKQENHIPFVEYDKNNDRYFVVEDLSSGSFYSETITQLTFVEALKVSASCCAQWSYRKLDKSLDKAEKIWSQLVESKPVHASPTEHQALAMGSTEVTLIEDYLSCGWQHGTTHVDKRGRFWSGNFRGWIQHRQVIDGNAVGGM